ncbi:MAG: ATP-binding cassette domain-containing protein [Synergistales bacterium]|nr:ATP-binding cassette domain-containing protein [Bacteroidales bacterium]MDY6394579.1 ATP-binding cassette domain-containing protein [Bacteroidales bacterium]MDY6402698.1 ATP-binding cassette domain-containing protein [Bacteroidales bacterium]MDY6423351.1 ATP-binding cassette domain-containing protein [Bacteroidales bacterium]MDY6435574.1 ATP-binding cassette domain-containing protein [Synergistales bacterium]
MGNILEIKNVTKSYAKKKAIDEVSFNVTEREVFGLLGPNGAGKTTLIRMINQITMPDSGEIYFNGERLSEKHISFVGYLPEERGLYKKMKVNEVVLYLAELKGLKGSVAKQRMDYWFDKFDITDWWNKKVEELSKGMQQKVQFITTVMHNPKLLIFDEPFSGFDPLNANLLKSEILNLKKQGSTIIFSTHNMESVEEICDSIVLINSAKNILQGKVNDIKQSFKRDEYEIITSSDEIEDVLPMGITLVSKQVGDNRLCTSVLNIPKGENANVLSALLKKMDILSYREILPSMNEIFINTVTQKA